MTAVDALVPVVHDVRRVAWSHGTWMVWNLLLAAVPGGLAVPLFRAGVRRTALWWTGLVLFALFLPNAPYVITDVVHLFDDIRNARSDLQVLGLFLPLYLAFFTLGFGGYVVALNRARAYVRTTTALPWLPIEAAVHVVCAAGIYLGRVVRLNSWEVFTRPRAVLDSVAWLVGPGAVVLVVCTSAALVAGTLIGRAVLAAVGDGLGRVTRRVRTGGPWLPLVRS